LKNADVARRAFWLAAISVTVREWPEDAAELHSFLKWDGLRKSLLGVIGQVHPAGAKALFILLDLWHD
jgi:hypothetical protein